MLEAKKKNKMIMYLIVGIILLVVGIIISVIIMVTYGQQTGPSSWSISANEDPGAFAGVCTGVIIALIGGILLFIGVIRKILKPVVQQMLYGAPGQRYPCSTCGQPLKYVQAYQRWYCDTCRKYV